MFQGDQTLQNELWGLSHRDLVSKDSDTWLYVDLFETLDMSDFDDDYEMQGQTAKEPRLMLRTLFYGLTHGVVSGRKLQEVCRNDNRFIVLSGNLRPDRRTFDRFIVRHEKHFKMLFVRVVQLAQVMGLISLGRVAIDGSKFKAPANQSMRYEKMNRAIKHIEDNLAQLKKDLQNENQKEATTDQIDQEIKDQAIRRERIQKAKAMIEEDFANRKKHRPLVMEKAHRALVDPEALSLSTRQGFYFGYNLQAAVDEKSQIVVACDLQDQATDYQALPKLVDQVQQNCHKHPDQYLADSGYQSLENIKKIHETGATPLICRKKSKAEKENDSEISEQITKGTNDREYFCMAKKQLPMTCRMSNGYISFKLPKDFCNQCKHQNKCKIFGKKHVEVLDDEDRTLYNSYIVWSRTQEYEESYKRRKAIVEPVFGNIKNKGIRIFCRGKKAVNRWWNIVTTAHNLEKIVKHMRLIPQM